MTVPSALIVKIKCHKPCRYQRHACRRISIRNLAFCLGVNRKDIAFCVIRYVNIDLPHIFRHTWQWRHNGCDGVSNHQPHDCLLNRFIQAQMKENTKAPRHWPLCGEFTSHRWIPRTNGKWRGKSFLLMTSSWKAELSREWVAIMHGSVIVLSVTDWSPLQIIRPIY